MKLSECVAARNLIFYAADGVEVPSERLNGVEIGNFKIKREEHKGQHWFVLTYEFTVTLEEARRWIIPSIGDDILCVVEAAQMEFRSDAA
jgi:hypothetical protein